MNAQSKPSRNLRSADYGPAECRQPGLRCIGRAPRTCSGINRLRASRCSARAETGRARADADKLLAQCRAEAAREREEMRADLRARAERAEREADAYRAELAQLRFGTGPDSIAANAVGGAQLAAGVPHILSHSFEGAQDDLFTWSPSQHVPRVRTRGPAAQKIVRA